MGQCSSISKRDDKFITTDYLQQCHFDDYLLPAEKFAALKREQALPCDQPEQRPVPGRAFAAAGRAVGHRHPPGQGQRAARCHPHRFRAENHPAGCGGAGSGAGADRPNQQLLPRIKITELLRTWTTGRASAATSPT